MFSTVSNNRSIATAMCLYFWYNYVRGESRQRESDDGKWYQAHILTISLKMYYSNNLELSLQCKHTRPLAIRLFIIPYQIKRSRRRKKNTKNRNWLTTSPNFICVALRTFFLFFPLLSLILQSLHASSKHSNFSIHILHTKYVFTIYIQYIHTYIYSIEFILSSHFLCACMNMKFCCRRSMVHITTYTIHILYIFVFFFTLFLFLFLYIFRVEPFV